MQLNYPRLALPDSEEVIAFRAIDNILRSDQQLTATLTRYASWAGTVEDVEEPTVSTCPWLRITPGGLASSWETEGQHRMPMQVLIEAAVVGSDFNQIGNLWACIRRALFPQGDDVARDRIRGLVHDARIRYGTITAPSYSVKIDEQSGSRIVRAEGTLELLLLINTP